MRMGMMTLALAAGVVVTPVAQAQDTRPGIAVLAMDNGGSYGLEAEDYEGLRVGLQQMLITELAQGGNLRLVERGRIREILAELDLAESDRVDANTAAEIGKLVGARYVILGSFIDFYGDFRVDTRVVSVQTSEIIQTVKAQEKREELYQLVLDLSENLIADLNLPPLPEPIRGARRERELPPEALVMYSRALMFKDRGETDKARGLLSRIQSEFPELTEATEELRQIGSP